MIELDRVGKRIGDAVVVDEVSLSIAEGELCVLIGSSGAGKSTILKMINRLIPLSAGAIRFAGTDIMQLRPEQLRRRMGYVIQSIGLFPHWNVARNVATVPALLGWPAARIGARVDELLSLFKLDPATFRGKYPHQLSIGQQQRVGVARALAADPAVLLMDEPFGALDPLVREELQDEVLRLHRDSGKTILFVTHDMDEALKLATRIALMDRGRLIQAGTPAELLTAPATPFARDFIGGPVRGIKLLLVERVAQRMRAVTDAAGEPIAADATLHQALSQMVSQGVDRLAVIDAERRPVGTLHLGDIVRR